MTTTLSRFVQPALLAAGFAFALQGCLVTHDRHPGTGTLTVESSIDGYADPVDCDVNRVDLLEVVIYDSAGHYYTEVNAPCEAFGVAIDLPDGVYGIDATLVDYSNRAATTTLALDGLDVYAGHNLVVPIDFPPNSFF